jgi:hypothetical protein
MRYPSKADERLQIHPLLFQPEGFIRDGCSFMTCVLLYPCVFKVTCSYSGLLRLSISTCFRELAMMIPLKRTAEPGGKIRVIKTVLVNEKNEVELSDIFDLNFIFFDDEGNRTGWIGG